MANNNQQNLDIYQKLDFLGAGAYGKVYRGINKITKEHVAIKVIELEDCSNEFSKVVQEISILKELNTQYVTRYYGSYVKNSELWIVMEFAGGGSVRELLEPTGSLEEVAIAIILREVLKALVYLHGEGKVHRDIKSANILLCDDGSVKLADFGVATQLTSTLPKRFSTIGTPYWMSPECISQTGVDAKSDIWSLGITSIEMANGRPPLYDRHPLEALMQIPSALPPILDSKFSLAFRDFVTRCLQKDPIMRPTAKELLNHKFILQSKNTRYLTGVIDTYRRWKETNKIQVEDKYHQEILEKNDTDEFSWAFPSDDNEISAEKGNGTVRRQVLEKEKPKPPPIFQSHNAPFRTPDASPITSPIHTRNRTDSLDSSDYESSSPRSSSFDTEQSDLESEDTIDEAEDDSLASSDLNDQKSLTILNEVILKSLDEEIEQESGDLKDNLCKLRKIYEKIERLKSGCTKTIFVKFLQKAQFVDLT